MGGRKIFRWPEFSPDSGWVWVAGERWVAGFCRERKEERRWRVCVCFYVIKMRKGVKGWVFIGEKVLGGF